MSRQLTEWRNYWAGKWTNVWVSEWVNGWDIEYVSDWVTELVWEPHTPEAIQTNSSKCCSVHQESWEKRHQSSEWKHSAPHSLLLKSINDGEGGPCKNWLVGLWGSFVTHCFSGSLVPNGTSPLMAHNSLLWGASLANDGIVHEHWAWECSWVLNCHSLRCHHPCHSDLQPLASDSTSLIKGVRVYKGTSRICLDTADTRPKTDSKLMDNV